MKIIADENIDAVICLSDGSFFFGKGAGSYGETVGEICFNTSITGYQEILTDPSYAGQIITFTFPHIGNVGCNDIDNESSKPHCKGLVIRDEITEDSNFRSKINLNEWLCKNNLTAICNIDTRRLTKNIRDKGARNSIIFFTKIGEEIDTDKLISKITDLPTLKNVDLASKVTTRKKYFWDQKLYDLLELKYSAIHPDQKKYKVTIIDYGIKENILRCLAEQNFDLTILPATASYADIIATDFDGIFLSNGPADPLKTSEYAVPVIKKLLADNVPIFGICMGHQLLCIAAGLSTIKMHQGHRGSNHPVKNLQNNLVEITSQNHGFCASKDNIPENVEVTHISLFDQTIQGIELKKQPIFSVQYHPESSPGPHDSRYLFDKFKQNILTNM
ncbi:MAG: carbamoyl-phosphate synthase small subunit [Rickettsiales bacterium]|jgi:carbamoyl-phosphate synthase small subunit